ncbi:MAG: Peptidoglycan-binding domain 1 protein [Parcubacteria group bacterium GW2011_GWF2_43_11]|nr:MAG: Peptidoglycan-binding domain 1 protein [Parcubacteria group bacterium GW2011_GWF2_43_11]
MSNKFPQDIKKNREKDWWGKKLFVILVIFLIATNVVTLGFLVHKSRQDSVKQFENPYPLIDFTRNFIPQEHYLTTLQPLRETLNGLADKYGRDNVSIYVEYLNTGASIIIGPEAYIWSASLPKLPIAMAVMKKIEDGDWKLSNELVLMPVDKDDDSGSVESSLWEYPVGTRFTIETLLQELLVNSDNTAHKIFFRNLHADEVDRVVIDLGLYGLFNEEGKMSAKEYSRFFRSLYTANFLNRENSQKLLEWLDESTFDDYLAQSVPAETPFPHKYGENTIQRVYSDSGIVYIPNRPYLITVMLAGNFDASLADDMERARMFMRRVSEEAYAYMSLQ